ncbi:hypothetical protein QQF64_014676 [Cirrhinus molitorella]|uniref:ribonuclease H n=1 Tax=Cirrhinus molitorella TaxID=172907 RepID=A0ABR3NST6_9TELE
MQELRDLIAQLQAENESLRLEQQAIRSFRRANQAFFLFGHLEGEAREEIGHRSAIERGDPAKIFAALRELYGCSLSYVALQEAFFSLRQQEGETLMVFSLVLMSLQERVKQQSPTAMPNAEMLLRDQFVEFVLDPALRHELKQCVRRQPMCTFLEVQGEAIRWEREGVPGGARGRCQSLPLVHGVQYGVQGTSHVGGSGSTAKSELGELRDMLRRQQEQLDQLAQGFARGNQGTAVTLCPAVRKLALTELQSHRLVGEFIGSISSRTDYAPQLVSACPHLNVLFGGVPIPCLIDTGSMVTESCFRKYFDPLGREGHKPCQWLQLQAANGLEIPYIGYVELDVELCGSLVPKCGVLVVADPPGGLCAQVPGVLGMNVIRRCYQELFGQHGPALFRLPAVSQAPNVMVQALQYCCQASAQSGESYTGKVKVQGRQVCRIPGSTMKLVPTTCSAQFSGSVVLFEPLETGLPSGLLASPALIRVNHGTAYVPVVNVGTLDALFYPRSLLGTFNDAIIVSVPPGISEVKSMSASLGSQAPQLGSSVLEKIKAMDLSMLTGEEECQVRVLLQKYQLVFSSQEGDLGCTNLIVHEIPLLDDIPVKQRYRRIPPSDYEAVKAHINQLLETQVIKESCSPYVSPIVLVKKKDGSLRMCVDYRQLNSRTRKGAFPLPRIEESLDALVGACWFSTLDLVSGYNQVSVAEGDRFKTAFCTPFGLFEYNQMPFGLCNAPSTFQRLMQRLFGDQQCQSVFLYLDDIVVFSSSVEQHLMQLEVVLSRLEQQGLKAKLEKCSFFQKEVRYLGHIISAEGVSTVPSKIQAVSQWRCPEMVGELCSFLGFASYYRRFVEGFAKLAAPLHRLVAEFVGARPKKFASVSFVAAWTEECQHSFGGLKSKLTSSPVLAYADFSRPFILEVDVSHSGLGAVLSQEQEGRVRPIAYASRSLRPTERNMTNCSSMKLEFVAFKWAMAEKFREYLLGQKCVVYTDNNPLSHLASAKLGATEQRWAAQLASFDFEVRYRSGRSNKNADALSRQDPSRVDRSHSEMLGTVVPVEVRQSLAPAATQATIVSLPSCSVGDIGALQKADVHRISESGMCHWPRAS